MSTKTKNQGGSKVVPCSSHDNCGPLHFPNTDKEIRERIKEKKAASRTKTNNSNRSGAEFEANAAHHNRLQIIKMENELRRKHKQRKNAISATAPEGESSSNEEVRATCSKCGALQDGDIDHVMKDKDGEYLVETKNSEQFNPAPDQRQTDRNLNQMSRLGNIASTQKLKIAYKIPAEHSSTAAEIEKAAKILNLNVKVILVKL